MNPPIKPVRNSKCKFYEIYASTVAGLISELSQYPGDGKVHLEDDDCCTISYSELEPEVDFEKRMKQYEKKLEKYQFWLEENKEKIAERDEKKKQKEIARLEKMLRNLRKGMQ